MKNFKGIKGHEFFEPSSPRGHGKHFAASASQRPQLLLKHITSQLWSQPFGRGGGPHKAQYN